MCSLATAAFGFRDKVGGSKLLGVEHVKGEPLVEGVVIQRVVLPAAALFRSCGSVFLRAAHNVSACLFVTLAELGDAGNSTD